jgi:hypothetical protein
MVRSVIEGMPGGAGWRGRERQGMNDMGEKDPTRLLEKKKI